MKKNLEYITKVSEYGNINKAAKKLFITPSALSKHIITKENQLGIELFKRTGKKFILTYAGEKYVEWANKIDQMQENMERELKSIAEHKTGIMHVGFQLMQSKTIFTKIIQEFKSVYPDIDLILESTHTHNLLNMLEDGLIDFAITTHKEIKEGFASTKLSQVEIVLVVPKGHKVVSKAIRKIGFKYPWVDIKSLENETFVGLYKNQEPRKVMDEIFYKNNISPKINMQVHTSELTILSVANDFGITIAYDQPAKFEEYRDLVELLSFGEQPVKRDLSIIYNKNYKPKEFTKIFFKICQKYYNK